MLVRVFPLPKPHDPPQIFPNSRDAKDGANPLKIYSKMIPIGEGLYHAICSCLQRGAKRQERRMARFSRCMRNHSTRQAMRDVRGGAGRAPLSSHLRTGPLPLCESQRDPSHSVPDPACSRDGFSHTWINELDVAQVGTRRVGDKEMPIRPASLSISGVSLEVPWASNSYDKMAAHWRYSMEKRLVWPGDGCKSVCYQAGVIKQAGAQIITCSSPP